MSISFPTIADSTPFYWLSCSYSKLSSSCNSRVSSYQKFSKLTFHDAVLTFDSSSDHLGVSTCWVGSFSLFFWLFGHCCMLFWLLSLLFGVYYSCSNKSSLRSLRRCYSLRSTLSFFPSPSNCIESPTNNRSLVYWIIKIIQPIFQISKITLHIILQSSLILIISILIISNICITFTIALTDNQQSVSTAYSRFYKIVRKHYFSKTVTAASPQKFLHSSF